MFQSRRFRLLATLHHSLVGAERLVIALLLPALLASEGSAQREATFGDFTYLPFSAAPAGWQIEIVGYTSTSTDPVTVPESINGRPVTRIGATAFAGGRFTQVTLPSSLVELGQGAFQACPNLESITIPEGVISIGPGAFRWCGRLTSVSLPSTLTALGESTFSSCSGLTRINVPDGVARLEKDTFRTCVRLSEITLPDTLTYIGEDCFFFCLVLPTITIPSSVTEIHPEALSACPALQRIQVTPENPAYADIEGILYDKDATTVLRCPQGFVGEAEVPASTSDLSPDAFHQCRGLTAISVAADNPGFSSRDGVVYDKHQETVIVCPAGRAGPFSLPPTVTGIGDRAFYNCRDLSGITLNDGLISIGSESFARCSGLLAIQLPPSLREIHPGAFYTCTGLEEIGVPNGVHVLAEGAFQGCSGLLRVTLPTTLGSLSPWLFADCASLPEIRIPEDVTVIGAGAFSRCSSLDGVEIPPSVSKIEDGAFRNCDGLRSIVIPPTVDHLGDSSFESCDGLAQVMVEGNPSFLGRDLFRGCPGLQDVTLSSELTNIPLFMFAECEALESVTIPASVTSIGTYAFSECGNLESAVFLGQAPASFSTGAFHLAATDFRIYHFGGMGFTAPYWNFYPTVNMGPVSPKTPWLVSHGLSHELDLNEDVNGDGVSLLMAYALDLDPTRNLAGSMPPVILEGNSMAMAFHAGAEGVVYRVEHSKDLMDWRTSGITLSDPDEDGVRTATVPLAGPCGYLRLAVESE